MDLLIAQITTDLRSSDALRQSSALLQALQQCAAGRDVSALARTAATEILSAPSSAVCKRLALDLLRALPLPPDILDPLLLSSLRSDLSFPDPDVAASSIASFPSLPLPPPPFPPLLRPRRHRRRALLAGRVAAPRRRHVPLLPPPAR
ncbi:hypothetical protein PR202_ga25099 [Eleusine coracana subsp. coracana]|uniref:Uncharacterized protein n=1 Tax=Eleusine coracana subsp. coracana TaxID=191504 RepID=A0AAV5DA48_ELECO|nr:hypothetical protein PR202_ga25099 [Eleusine coracana subsp. coracana]